MPRTLLSALKLAAVVTVSALLLSACVPFLGPPRGPMPIAGPALPAAPLPLAASPVPGPR